MKMIKIKTTKEIIEELEVSLPLFVKDQYYYYAIFEENKYTRISIDNYEKSISYFLLSAKNFVYNQQISKDEFMQAYIEAKEYIDNINIDEFMKNNKLS
jgi:hypothetical protein